MIYIADIGNAEYLQHLVPNELVSLLSDGRHFCLFATDEQNTPVSIFISQLEDGYARLIWLFTAQEQRRRGYARALLLRLKELAKKTGAIGGVLVSVPSDEAAVSFFLSVGFLLPAELDVEFSTTVGALEKEQFWNDDKDESCIVPLETVKNYLLRPFMLSVNEQGNPAGLPDDLDDGGYLRHFSLACVERERLTGVLLAERAEDGGIQVSAVHVLEQGAVAKKLIQEAGRLALEQCPPDTPIHIIATNDASKRLSSRLLSNTKRRYICRLYMPISER